MPVHECTHGIVLPRPDMQRVEGRQSEAIGGFEVVKDLSHELRRRARMLLIPSAGDDKIVRSGQFHASVRLRFVEDDLGTRGIDDAAAHQGVIHEVEAHGPKVVAAHATEFKVITLVLGRPYILKAFGRPPDNSEKGVLPGLLARSQFLLWLGLRVRVNVLRQGAQRTNAHEKKSGHGILSREVPNPHPNGGNLCCSHWILSPVCKIGAHRPRRLLLTASAATHFARIRSVKPLILGALEDRVTEC